MELIPNKIIEETKQRTIKYAFDEEGRLLHSYDGNLWVYGPNFNNCPVCNKRKKVEAVERQRMVISLFIGVCVLIILC